MAEEKQYDILTTMHGSFKTTFTKKHLARKPWQPENPKHCEDLCCRRSGGKSGRYSACFQSDEDEQQYPCSPGR